MFAEYTDRQSVNNLPRLSLISNGGLMIIHTVQHMALKMHVDLKLAYRKTKWEPTLVHASTVYLF